MTVPEVENTAVRPASVRADSFSVTVSPVASVICEATVRCQISS